MGIAAARRLKTPSCGQIIGATPGFIGGEFRELAAIRRIPLRSDTSSKPGHQRADGRSMKRVVIEKARRIFDDFFKIDEAHLRFERFDGQMSPVVRRLSLERGDSVAALVFNIKTQRVILVNQFKYPTYKKGPGWITETVAGMIDQGESAEDAMRREVLEETGYRVSGVERIATFYVSPGGSSERIILYYAEVDEEKAGKGGGIAQEHEDIRTFELALDDAVAQVASGEIADAKTIIGLMWPQNRASRDQATTAPDAPRQRTDPDA
jgi:ADP-ribose pyrophosphatase